MFTNRTECAEKKDAKRINLTNAASVRMMKKITAIRMNKRQQYEITDEGESNREHIWAERKYRG
jgi:3-methyladenine DNA glycosylase Tag